MPTVLETKKPAFRCRNCGEDFPSFKDLKDHGCHQDRLEKIAAYDEETER